MSRYGIALGMPTLPQMAGISQCAALCAELSFSFVELSMCLPEYQPGRLNERAVERAKKKHGVYFTLHLDEQCNPFDFNPYVSEAYLETVRFAIRLARRHQMPVINMHMPEGSRCTLPGRRVYLFEQYAQLMRR